MNSDRGEPSEPSGETVFTYTHTHTHTHTQMKRRSTPSRHDMDQRGHPPSTPAESRKSSNKGVNTSCSILSGNNVWRTECLWSRSHSIPRVQPPGPIPSSPSRCFPLDLAWRVATRECAWVEQSAACPAPTTWGHWFNWAPLPLRTALHYRDCTVVCKTISYLVIINTYYINTVHVFKSFRTCCTRTMGTAGPMQGS